MLISFVSQVCTFHHDIKRLQELHEVLQSMKPAQIAINMGRVMKAASLPYVGFVTSSWIQSLSQGMDAHGAGKMLGPTVCWLRSVTIL